MVEVLESLVGEVLEVVAVQREELEALHLSERSHVQLGDLVLVQVKVNQFVEPKKRIQRQGLFLSTFPDTSDEQKSGFLS